MTHTDPRCQFLIDYEISKLDWMDHGPRRTQAEHMAKVRVLSMPWQDMLDLYAKTKWGELHGRIRVIQKTAWINGQNHNTRYLIEQNIHGQWTKIPVTEEPEDDPQVLAKVQELVNTVVRA